MKRMRALSLLALLSAAIAVHGQDTTAGPDSAVVGRYAIVLHVGGGVTWYPRGVGTPVHLRTHADNVGVLGSVRLMWQPDHRLRVGIESGWTPINGYTIEGPGPTGSLHLTAVPLLLVWSMPVAQRFNVYAGFGTYRITSSLDYLGTTRTSTFSLGYSAALSFTQPLSDDLGVSAEVEWMNAAETRHTLFCLQARLVWKLFQW